MEIQKWDYRQWRGRAKHHPGQFDAGNDDPPMMHAVFDLWGSEGWELVTVVNYDYGTPCEYIFKLPKIDD